MQQIKKLTFYKHRSLFETRDQWQVVKSLVPDKTALIPSLVVFRTKWRRSRKIKENVSLLSNKDAHRKNHRIKSSFCCAIKVSENRISKQNTFFIMKNCFDL